MSGRPDPVQVRDVRQFLIREAEIEDRSTIIMRDLALLKKEYESLSDELRALRKQRMDAMQRMDLTQSGNYGHEARMSVFLMELVKPRVPADA